MKLLVAGGGAMGTALAGVLSQRHEVTLWCRRPGQAEELAGSRVNREHLPGYILPASVRVVSGPVEASPFGLLLLAVPTQHLRHIVQVNGWQTFSGPVVNTAKGLELKTLRSPCRILEDLGVRMSALFALSGPSHAEEFAHNQPTSLVLAGENEKLAEHLQKELSVGPLRIYTSPDRLGVELGGALKNIIAIAAGMSDGMGFGANTKSAIITRGLAEIRKAGVALGAMPETFSGLSGIGDLITTCCSTYSRNRAFGEAQIKNPEAFDPHLLVEGASTVIAFCEGFPELDLPLCRAVYDVVRRRHSPREVLKRLLSRPFKPED